MVSAFFSYIAYFSISYFAISKLLSTRSPSAAQWRVLPAYGIPGNPI